MSDLDKYERAGYAWGDGDDRTLALDAAVRFTASPRGPPFDKANDGRDWWVPAYTCACRALESAIVAALVGGCDE